jgi:hypothetical protein
MNAVGEQCEADFLELVEQGARYSFATQYVIDEEVEEVYIFGSVEEVIAWAKA